jgi:hypothetical protein
MFDPYFRTRFLTGLVLLQIATFSMSGCGAGGKPQATISGSVKFKGQPVTSGTVNLFQKATGAAGMAVLDSSGNFKLPSPLETGTYNISVTPPVPKQLPPGTPAETPAPFLVPIKYQDASQSDINKEIKTGDNKLEIVIPE